MCGCHLAPRTAESLGGFQYELVFSYLVPQWVKVFRHFSILITVNKLIAYSDKSLRILQSGKGTAVSSKGLGALRVLSDGKSPGGKALSSTNKDRSMTGKIQSLHL